MKVIHLVNDEKFIDFIARQFALTGDEHRYIVYQPGGTLRHIKEVEPWRTVDDSYFASSTLQQDLAACDGLIVHFMTPMAARMVLQAPHHITIAWSGWGADYYHLLPGGDRALLGEKTARIERRLSRQKALRHPVAMAKFLLGRVRRHRLQTRLILPALRRVHIFSAPLPEDYTLLQKALGPAFTARYSQINYASVEETFAVGAVELAGNDILVGNSASASNNHVEAFEILAQHDLTGRKVVVPLSYGDADYRDEILRQGRAILAEQFDPIVDFMPLADYNAHIARCAVVVMNHQRQQALGNIGTLLYQGAKLFFDERNVVYDFLRQRGAHVYRTAELEHDNAFAPLTAEQRAHNKHILQGFWGHDTVAANTLRFMNTLRQLNA